MKALVCIGGGDIPRYKNGVLLSYETKEIDEEIVRLINKSGARISSPAFFITCFIYFNDSIKSEITFS